MKKTFTRTLCLLVLFLTMSIFSKAQYMCTDINPDSVITKSTAGTYTWNIDINNDNIGDFQYSLVLSGPNFGFLNFQSGVASMTQNFVLTTSSGSIAVLPAGTPIAATSTSWHPMNASNPNFFLMAAGPPQGLWAGQTDKYVGVAVAVSTNTYFGWIKMSASNSVASYTVKEYGFNSVAGATIAAGQACVPPSTFAISFNSPSVVCQSSLGLTANTGTVTPNSYYWSSSPPGLVFTPTNAASTVVNFPPTGTFVISVSATSGTMTGLASNTVIVYPTPNVTVSASNNPICNGASAILTATGTATSYTWNTTANTQTISVTPSVTTTYTVGGSANGCPSSTAAINLTVVSCAGLSQINEMENGFDMYPNPANDKLNIRSLNSGQKNVIVIVKDLLGKTQLQHSLDFSNQYSTHSLNLSELSKGVYFVILKGESGDSNVTRIMKE